MSQLSIQNESTERALLACDAINKARLVVDSLEGFLELGLPPREMLLEPWLPSQGLAMVHAYRGIGKTHFSLAVGYAVASGSAFLKWKAPKPAGVLLLDGEMPGPALQERLTNIVNSNEGKLSAPFKIMTPDRQPRERPPFNLVSPEDQQDLEKELSGISLIIVDNLATLCRTSQTNDADSWAPVQEWALRQRSSGRSVLFIHHSGKSGAQRGTSAKEDVLDSVIGLKRPSDYKNAEGARFEVHFEKHRGFSGNDAEPIEARLTADALGRDVWITTTVEDAIFERVIELHSDGLNGNEIAEEVGRHKSNISRMLKRAKEEGRIR
jgi:putative DNA primase/helicase